MLATEVHRWLISDCNGCSTASCYIRPFAALRESDPLRPEISRRHSSVACIRRIAYDTCKPRGAANRVPPDDLLPLPRKGPEVATGANVNIVLAIAPTITSRIQRLEAFWHTQSQADNSINHQRAKKNHEDWPHWHRTALVDLENSQNPSSSQVSLKRLAPFAWKPMRLPRTRPSVPRRRQRSRYRRRYCHPSGIRRHRDEEVGAP